MSEPTIDEMLEWTRNVVTQENADVVYAIHGILKQAQAAIEPEALGIPALVHGFNAGVDDARKRLELQAVRAFVERVEDRLDVSSPYADALHAMQDELAAMTKEAE